MNIDQQQDIMTKKIASLRLDQEWELVSGPVYKSSKGLVHVCSAVLNGTECGFSYRDEQGNVMCVISGVISRQGDDHKRIRVIVTSSSAAGDVV
jgi:hypothetical protein